MPRRKSISNSKVEDFEPKKKNPLSLLNDSNLDVDSKPLFIGGKPSGIELSDSEFRFLKPSTHTRLNADTLFCNEFLLDSSGDSNLTFRHILGDDDQNMKFFISTAGATTWQTNGSSGTFNVDAVGAINLDTDSGEFYISDDSVTHLFFDCNNTALTIYDDEDTGDLFKIQVAQHGATTISTVDDDASAAHLTLNPDGDVKFDSDGILIKDNGDVSTPASGYGTLYVNSDVLYFKTDGGTATNLLSGGGGTTRWVRNTGGYITNKTSTTLYYFQFRPNSDLWSNSDSSPTSINQYDAPACQFHAPADGTLTNITAMGYVNDTGATDPFKFYVYKGAVANDGTNTSLTLIGTSDAPATISGAAKTFSINTDISSSNSFSAGDGLWVMWKKDSNTGSQDVYFSVTISGEYD